MIDAGTMRATLVNSAFETITGRSRQFLLDHPSLWEDLVFPEDRRRLPLSLPSSLEWQLRRAVASTIAADASVRNVIMHLRGKSGDAQLTAYSADRIDFDGHDCVLAACEDVFLREFLPE